MPGASTERAGVTLRESRPADGPAIGALTGPEIERSPYSWSLRSAVDAVLAGSTAESRGLVAAQNDRIVGIAIVGAVAGSVGAGRLQLVVTDRELRRRGIASALIDHALADLAAEGMRVAFVELPDDPALQPARELLLRCRFRVDARVADFFRDGADLVVLRRDLP